MTTTPYLADAPELLPYTLGQHVQVTAHTAAGETVLLLPEAGSTLSFDSTRSPRVVAAITTRVPEDQATLDALDPRTGVRLRVQAGYLRPDGPDVHQVADLGLRTRPVARPANLMALGAGGDECTVLEDAPSTRIRRTAAANVLVPELLATALGYPPTIVANTLPATVLTVALDEDGDYWATLDDLCDRVGGDLYDDGQRGWHLVTRPVLAEPVHHLTVGARSTVLDSSTTVAREGWANVVQITYRWTETGTYELTQVSELGVTYSTTQTFDIARHLVGVAEVTEGPYAPGTAGRVVFRDSRDVATTQAEADAAAAAVLLRRLADGRTVVLRAIAAWWLRPGMTVLVTLPTGPTLEYLVTAVTFDLAAGSMAVTAVRPDRTAPDGE